MTSMMRGQSSTSAIPTLEVYIARPGPPLALLDVAVLEFRILDISTEAKKTTPLQVYPAIAGTYQVLDPTLAPAAGHRLGTGHFYAPFTVPTNEALGDHRIEWRFKETISSPYESIVEQFYVGAAVSPTFEPVYCTIPEIRSQGYTSTTKYPDSRIFELCQLASRAVDRFTGRWFYPKAFSEANPMKLDGTGQGSIQLDPPICAVTKVQIESQAYISGDLITFETDTFRTYNRHLAGVTEPDDRENPRLEFIVAGKLIEIVTTGLFPAPRKFPIGKQNVFIQGYFGYTDFDPSGSSPLGITPPLIRVATRRLVARDLLNDSEACAKLNDKNRFRISSDSEGGTSVSLQGLWIKGPFTGDPEIDQILVQYRCPPRLGSA